MIAFGIIMLILTVIIFVVGKVFFTNGKRVATADDVDEYDRRQAKKMAELGQLLKKLCFIPIAILLIVSLISSIRIIDSTEIGVIKTFGEISGTIDEGLHFVNPFTDKVTTYDLRVHVKEASFASYTKDAQPLTAAIEYQYELDPAYVMEVAQKYGSYEILESKLCNIVEERAKIVFARYSAMNLLENRSKLSAEVDTEVTNVENMFHVTFTSVIIRDIDFSEAFEASVEAKMEAEQNALKAEQEKKQAVIKAEEAREVAAIEAEAKVLEAQGEADALKITREALEQMPNTWIEQMYLEKWNGVLPQIVTDNSSLMINPNFN